jgi:hypothetical protein
MPPRHRMGVADAVNPPKPMISGNGSLRKTCSIEVLDAVSDAEARLARLRDSAAIADQPDRAWVDDWLHRSYLNFWARGH